MFGISSSATPILPSLAKHVLPATLVGYLSVFQSFKLRVAEKITKCDVRDRARLTIRYYI